MVGHMRVGHPWELYLAVVSREFRIPLEMHKCSRVFSASDVVPKMCAKLVARVRYSTALPHLLLFIIFLISHVYYICYFILTMYGHQGNAGTLSHVIFC